MRQQQRACVDSTGRYSHERPVTPQRGVIRVDERESTVVCDERRVMLTRQQMLILSILVRRKGMVSYDEVRRTIDPNARLANAAAQVTTQIANIRRLLSRADIPLSILTVHGRGYYVEPDVELVSSKRPAGARAGRGRRRNRDL